MILNEIYKNNKSINYIINSNSAWVNVLSHAETSLPLLDDLHKSPGHL